MDSHWSVVYPNARGHGWVRANTAPDDAVYMYVDADVEPNLEQATPGAKVMPPA